MLKGISLLNAQPEPVVPDDWSASLHETRHNKEVIIGHPKDGTEKSNIQRRAWCDGRLAKE
jgi:hypothetical protein